MKVALVGAGAVGLRAARQLAATPGLERVFVSDPDAERLDGALAALGRLGSVGGPQPGAVTLLCSPPGDHRDRAIELIEAGIDVVSVSDSPSDVRGLLELDAEALERRRRIVVGAGFSPGLTCLLARHAATRFDHVDEIHVAKIGTGGPACARQHHDALGSESLDWRDGAWQRRPGGSGRELCWFPDPIAGRDCYRGALADALLLVPAIIGVQRVTARIAATRRDRFTAFLPMLRPPTPRVAWAGCGSRSVAVVEVVPMWRSSAQSIGHRLVPAP